MFSEEVSLQERWPDFAGLTPSASDNIVLRLGRGGRVGRGEGGSGGEGGDTVRGRGVFPRPVCQ